ncbi:hypothetical protein R3P38DRAFT_2783582 [Favolaschia claudopus]|uniref:Uncharacterized protein n=1 Tax=Favolaschia claudopus TaxID=2862362 RepID=A0AAW0AZQ4_9AGAR
MTILRIFRRDQRVFKQSVEQGARLSSPEARENRCGLYVFTLCGTRTRWGIEPGLRAGMELEPPTSQDPPGACKRSLSGAIRYVAVCLGDIASATPNTEHGPTSSLSGSSGTAQQQGATASYEHPNWNALKRGFEDAGTNGLVSIEFALTSSDASCASSLGAYGATRSIYPRLLRRSQKVSARLDKCVAVRTILSVLTNGKRCADPQINANWKVTVRKRTGILDFDRHWIFNIPGRPKFARDVQSASQKYDLPLTHTAKILAPVDVALDDAFKFRPLEFEIRHFPFAYQSPPNKHLTPFSETARQDWPEINGILSSFREKIWIRQALVVNRPRTCYMSDKFKRDGAPQRHKSYPGQETVTSELSYWNPAKAADLRDKNIAALDASVAANSSVQERFESTQQS